MMALVIGGSGSGKSEYGEKEAEVLCKGTFAGKYYAATMRIFDEEGRKKAHRHQAMRRGKGFVTIEQPVDICRALEKVKTGTVQPVILVECISNLTANEMFLGEGRQRTAEETGEKIVRDIGTLKKAAHLVVITNNVFEDGIVYEEPVMEYIRAMGRINGALAGMADKVVEVMAGIPVMIKDTGGM